MPDTTALDRLVQEKQAERLPSVAAAVVRKGEQVWGCDVNGKGFKVLRGAAVIQGDGMTLKSLGTVLDAVLAAGYSAASVLFGMGGGLLQKHNRDTMSFATKLSHIVYADGTSRDIMKYPKTDKGKVSLPGELCVKRVGGVPTVFPLGAGPASEPDMLEVIYDMKPNPNFKFEDFDTVRARAEKEWTSLPPLYNPISKELQAKIDAWVAEKKAFLATYMSI